MIKRIIFDIDNTLLPWKKEYDNEIKNTLDELEISYTYKELEEISNAFKEYENKFFIYNKKKLSDFINIYTHKNFPKDFVDRVIKKWTYCVPDKIEIETIRTLEYLKSKYELVLLTNWFKEEQKERLKKVDLFKYFLDIYAAEKVKRKPFAEAFLQAIGNNRPEECLMIGDNLEIDIKGALNAGLNAIYLNLESKNEKEYKCISKLEDLIKIL